MSDLYLIQYDDDYTFLTIRNNEIYRSPYCDNISEVVKIWGRPKILSSYSETVRFLKIIDNKEYVLKVKSEEDVVREYPEYFL